MKIKQLLKGLGFYKAEEVGNWNGLKVSVATTKENMCVGLPQFILTDEQKNDSRWASPEETITLMFIFCV